MAIFLYVAGAIVEMIARGVFTGAGAERRRRRMIEAIHDHHIICGKTIRDLHVRRATGAELLFAPSASEAVAH